MKTFSLLLLCLSLKAWADFKPITNCGKVISVQTAMDRVTDPKGVSHVNIRIDATDTKLFQLYTPEALQISLEAFRLNMILCVSLLDYHNDAMTFTIKK